MAAEFSAPLKSSYPRSHERGPVEASTGNRREPGAECSIHAHMSVAPLKLFNCAGKSAAYPFYPRSHERGPVEAANAYIVKPGPTSAYPRSHERGPVEAAGPHWPWRAYRDLSTLT